MAFTNIPDVPLYTGSAPNRNTQQQAEFSTNSDDSLQYQATLADNINATAAAMSAVADEVQVVADDAQDSADSATASAAASASNANYVGKWVDQSGAANVPYSVSHNGDNWQLLSNIADVTASEPSTANTDWIVIIGQLVIIARSLNALDSEVIYSDDTSTVLTNVKYIYNPVSQVVWSKPDTVLAGEFIATVAGDLLTTDLANAYTLSKVETKNAPPLNDTTEIPSLTGFVVAGQRIEWLGYYVASDGGSNWGIVKNGAHTADGFTIFSIDANTYIEANLKGYSVNPRKAGAKGDNGTDDLIPINNAIAYAESAGIKKLKWSDGKYRHSDTLIWNHQTIWQGSGTDSCQIIPLASMTGKPAVTNTQTVNALWSGYQAIRDLSIRNVEAVFDTNGLSLKGAVWEWELNNVSCHGFGLAGFKFDRCYRGRMINCGTYSCGQGGSESAIYIMSSDPADRSSNIRISGGNVQDTPANIYALRVDGAIGCTIDMLTFQSNGRGATFEGTTNCAMRDCYMEDLDREINLIVGTNGRKNQSFSATNIMIIGASLALPILLEGDLDTIFDNVRGVGSNVTYIGRNTDSRRSRIRDDSRGLFYADTNASYNKIDVVKDDFQGVALNTNVWRAIGNGTATIINAGGSRCELATTANIASTSAIYPGIAALVYATENPVVECISTLKTIASVNYRPIDMVNGTSHIRVYASNGIGGVNFTLECTDGATTSSQVMTPVCDTASHGFKIEVMSDSVKCWIDGKDMVEVTASIPTVPLDVGSAIISNENVAKAMDLTSFRCEKDFNKV